MYALWKFFSVQWERLHQAAEEAINLPSRTFIEIATHPTTTSPLPTTNYGWIFSLLFGFMWMLVLSLFCAANCSDNLATKISVQRYRNQVKRLEEQVACLEDAHEETNDRLIKAHNDLLAASATYNANLQQKDTEHSAELNLQLASHLYQMGAYESMYHDAIIDNRTLYQREIQGLKSEKNNLVRNLGLLSERVHRKDTEINDLQDEILDRKRDLILCEYYLKTEMETQKQRRTKAADAAYDKAWDKAEEEIRDAKLQVSRVKTSLKYLQEKCETASSEAAQAELRAKKAESAEAQLAEQFEAKNIELIKTAEVVKNLERALDALRTSNTAKEQVTAQLKKDAEDAAKEMTRKTKEWEAERKQLVKKLGLQGRAIEAKPTQKARKASAEAAKPTPEMAAVINELNRTRSEASEVRKELITVNTALELNESKLGMLSNEVDQLRKSNSVLQKSNFVLQKNNSRLEKDQAEAINSRIQLMQATRATNSSLQATLDTKSAELDHTTNKLKKATDDLKTSKKALAAAETKLGEANAHIRRTGDIYTGELDAMQKELNEQKQVIASLTEQLKKSEADVVDQVESINELLQSNDSLQLERNEFQETVSKLSAEREATAIEMVPLKKIEEHQSMLLTQMDRHRREISELKERLGRECVCKRQPFSLPSNPDPAGDDMDIEEGEDDTMNLEGSSEGSETGETQSQPEVEMLEAGDSEGPVRESGTIDTAMEDAWEDVLPQDVRQQQAVLNPANDKTDADLNAALGSQPSSQPMYDGMDDAQLAEALVASRRLTEAKETTIGASSKATRLDQDLGLNIDFESTHASKDAQPEMAREVKGKGKAPAQVGIPRTRIFPETTRPTDMPLPGLTSQVPEASPILTPAAAAAPPPLPRDPSPPTGESKETTSENSEDTGSGPELTLEDLQFAAELEEYLSQDADEREDGGKEADANTLELIDPCQMSERDSDELSELSSSDESARELEKARQAWEFQDGMADSDDQSEDPSDDKQGKGPQGEEQAFDELVKQVEDERLMMRLLDEKVALRNQIAEEEAGGGIRTVKEIKQAYQRYEAYWRALRKKIPEIEEEERVKRALEAAKIKGRPKIVPKSKRR